MYDPYAALRAHFIAERKALGMTQSQLADRMGWTPSRVTQHESGYVRFLTVESLHTWADALGLEIQLCAFVNSRGTNDTVSFDFEPEPVTGYTGPAS